MSVADQTKLCAVTGANGYVGSRVKAHLESSGIPVADWTRCTAGGAGVSFQLGQDVDAKLFAGTKALVHCAYDFSGRRWADVERVNVRGSERLFRAAKAGGVERLVFISSISAFNGCRSLYGRAKLDIEAIARSLGATVIRPGLVYGDSPGGVFGGVVKQVRGGRFVPLIGDGKQLQYLVHCDDLCRLIERCVKGELTALQQPITLAHEEGWSLRHLLTTVGEALGKKPVFVPVPWRLVWLGLKSLETAGLPSPFRSDSLISLIYQNPSPSFVLAKSLQADCRRFEIKPAMLG